MIIKTTDKYCLVILFQLTDNNPIEYVGNKAAQFSKISGVGRTTSLTLLHPWAKNFFPFQESIRAYPNLPHCLLPSIKGSPWYPLRASLFIQPQTPKLLISAQGWANAHVFTFLTTPSIGPSGLAPLSSTSSLYPQSLHKLPFTSSTQIKPWLCLRKLMPSPCSPLRWKPSPLLTPRFFKACVPDVWPLPTPLLLEPQPAESIYLTEPSAWPCLPPRSDILATPLTHWAPGSSFPSPSSRCHHSQGPRHSGLKELAQAVQTLGCHLSCIFQ